MKNGLVDTEGEGEGGASSESSTEGGMRVGCGWDVVGGQPPGEGTDVHAPLSSAAAQ